MDPNMDPNSELHAINDEHTRAIAVMALIYAGEFDHHLSRILGVITRRMATPEFQHYRPPTMAAANNGREMEMSESPEGTPVEVTPDHVQVDLPPRHPDEDPRTEEEAEQPPQVIVTQPPAPAAESTGE